MVVQRIILLCRFNLGIYCFTVDKTWAIQSCHSLYRYESIINNIFGCRFVGGHHDSSYSCDESTYSTLYSFHIHNVAHDFFIGGSRLVVRGLINTRQVKEKGSVIIYGAGASGCQLALALKHGAEYNPVALIDDNLELKNTNVAGLKVYSRDDMEGIISKYNVSKILLAIPSASAKCRKKPT